MIPASRSRSRFLGRLGLIAVAALFASGCTAAASTSAPSQTVAAATDTAGATSSPTPTPLPTATTTATPSPTLAPTQAPTPLPPLAVGLCTGSQLKLVITAWYPDSGSGVYAHLTAKNKSTKSCNMRGAPEARIVDGHGRIIGDSGAAKISSGDTVYPLSPGGTINTIVTWFNWCKTAPAQKVTVAAVQPFGLGGEVAAPLGNAPIPQCWISGGKTQVSVEAWLP